MFGKSRGGKLTHDDSKDNIFTQELFEMPLVKAKDNTIYGSYSKSSDDPKKLLYRHIFDHEADFEDSVTKYGSPLKTDFWVLFASIYQSNCTRLKTLFMKNQENESLQKSDLRN